MTRGWPAGRCWISTPTWWSCLESSIHTSMSASLAVSTVFPSWSTPAAVKTPLAMTGIVVAVSDVVIR
jgi:hypothetical protein